MNRRIAVLDACVLYPAPLRDFLMCLAVKNLFRPRWTNDIHDEWIRSLLKNRPDLQRKQLERTRELMNTHARDSLVFGHEKLIDSLKLPDPNDRHVLAAAIHSGAEVILTFNLKDFPEDVLAEYEITAINPDDFILDLLTLMTDEVAEAAELQRGTLRNPAKTEAEFLNILTNVGLVNSVKKLQELK
ncbi:MAG: PIN domain-containing protein [Isosphaeraceae bacterium]